MRFSVKAVKEQTSCRLQPGEVFSVEVQARIYAQPDTWWQALERTKSVVRCPLSAVRCQLAVTRQQSAVSSPPSGV